MRFWQRIESLTIIGYAQLSFRSAPIPSIPL
jgi:hypothetical protein